MTPDDDREVHQAAALAGHAAVDVRGERLWLLPSRAVWWPARNMLILADPHFGKAAAYRALGQPVPSGTTRDTLDRLDGLTASLPVSELVVLGDFLHARSSRTVAVTGALQRWRDGLPKTLRCTLVRGNHDARAGDPPASLGFDMRDEPWHVGPLALCHLPGASQGAGALGQDGGYELAGHLHPACVLRTGGDALRLPCFVLGARAGILPAFGAFTGHATVRPGRGDRLFAIGGGRVWPLPVPAAATPFGGGGG